MSMCNVVIVEDRLESGISLARQFQEIAGKHSDWNVSVESVCYFQKNEKLAKEEIGKYIDLSYEIIPLSLWNFNEQLDKYYFADEKYVIVFDFLLDDDGSEGRMEERVNIRYAKNKMSENKIWFYTARGITTERILKELVGEDHVLGVAESNSKCLRLNIEENKDFVKLISD